MIDCLYKDLFSLSDIQRSMYLLPKPYCVFTLMSDQSPRSPLSLTSGSDGSGSDMQDNVSLSHNSAQSSNPTLLDGIKSHNSD